MLNKGFCNYKACLQVSHIERSQVSQASVYHYYTHLLKQIHLLHSLSFFSLQKKLKNQKLWLSDWCLQSGTKHWHLLNFHLYDNMKISHDLWKNNSPKGITLQRKTHLWFAFFILCLFSFISFCVHRAISQCFLWVSLTQMAGYNHKICSWLIANGIAFSFGQHKSVGRSLTFRVLVYRWRNMVYTCEHNFCIMQKPIISGTKQFLFCPIVFIAI